MSNYNRLPASATGNFENFEVHVPEDKLTQFKDLIRISPIGPVTYENQRATRDFGVSRSWLVEAKKNWETTFDWYKFMSNMTKIDAN
jgi:microsomal epoxide hydrolase